MADQLLSIDSSNLESVADEIRTKAGLSSSQKLVFPDTDEQGKLGMISALQGITTEATITPKISPQQVTLTKDSTSFAISPGFHDGNGTVGIILQSKTVTPNSSQQEVVPDTGKLLSQVIVNAVANGYKMAMGTVTADGTESLTISGLNFTPIGGCAMIYSAPSISSVYEDTMFAISTYKPEYTTSGDVLSDSAYSLEDTNSRTASQRTVPITYSSNSITFGRAYEGYSWSVGTLYRGSFGYIVWGN